MGPLVYIICHVLFDACMCIVSTFPRVWYHGVGCVGCQHILGYSTLCVRWIGVYGQFGVLHCCVELCEGVLHVGGCTWRVDVVMCQFCGLGKVCSWGWDILVANKCSFGGFQCTGHSEILKFM